MPKVFSKAEAEEFFIRLKKLDPEPKTELQYVNPYTLLVAVALSAQATDKSVNKATEPLFKTIDTPEKMLALGETRLADAIKTIGLYRGKAKNVIAAAKILIDKHDGKVPQDRQRDPERGVRRADHCGGHPYLPRLQPHRPGAGQGCCGGGDGPREDRARTLQEPCPSLADPPWALYLHRA